MKKIIKYIISLGTFLLILLLVILVFCTLFVLLTNSIEKKELETQIIETTSQLEFIFEDGDTITLDDFENGVAIKTFTVFNNSDSTVNVGSIYQLNISMLKNKGFDRTDIVYSVKGTSTGEGIEDKLIDTGTLALPNFSSSVGMGSIVPQAKHTYRLLLKYIGKENIKDKDLKMELKLIGNLTYLVTNNK